MFLLSIRDSKSIKPLQIDISTPTEALELTSFFIKMLSQKLLSSNGAVIFRYSWQISILRYVQARTASKASSQLASHQVSKLMHIKCIWRVNLGLEFLILVLVLGPSLKYVGNDEINGGLKTYWTITSEIFIDCDILACNQKMYHQIKTDEKIPNFFYNWPFNFCSIL